MHQEDPQHRGQQVGGIGSLPQLMGYSGALSNRQVPARELLAPYRLETSANLPTGTTLDHGFCQSKDTCQSPRIRLQY